jgi:hypothetical protein
MTKEQFERESRYRVSISIADTMLREGLISKEEYTIIDTIFIEKYRPLFGALCA